MNEKVIELLNEARGRELTAIAQYMSQHYELEDKEFGKLASKIKEISIQEMRHAEALAERILFLGGVPISKPDTTARKGEEMAAMMTTDIGLEEQAIKMYNEAAMVCAQERDQVSKDLFEKLLVQEEEHINFFQNTEEHIQKLGGAFIATLVD